jgi:hypothetical protein
MFCFRGLCVDALIELSDENADWKLSFQEFLKCLNPSFNPPEKSMPNLELESCWGWRHFWGGQDKRGLWSSPEVAEKNPFVHSRLGPGPSSAW